MNGAGGDSDSIPLELERNADTRRQCLCPVVSITKRNPPSEDHRHLSE